MLTCDCELAPLPVWRSKYQRARKDHRCDECGRLILKGEEYFYNFSVDFDGRAWQYHGCEECSDLWESLVELGYCRILFGLEEAYETYIHEVLGRYDLGVVKRKGIKVEAISYV